MRTIIEFIEDSEKYKKGEKAFIEGYVTDKSGNVFAVVVLVKGLTFTTAPLSHLILTRSRG